jgi:transcriptional regulator with XRE-family HTH domain
MKKLAKAIAARLKFLREGAGLSQQDVAMKADLSLSLVAKMEQGKKADPRASTLLALAGALGVPPGRLLDDLFPPPTPEPTAQEAPAENGQTAAEEPEKNGGARGRRPGPAPPPPPPPPPPPRPSPTRQGHPVLLSPGHHPGSAPTIPLFRLGHCARRAT